MTEPYVTNGDDVFPNPTIPRDGGVVMHAGMIKPPVTAPRVNGAPVVETSHEFVVTDTPSVPGPSIARGK